MAEPQAYLVYKPHPDVAAGLCRAGAGEDDAAQLCDEVLTQGSIQQLFTQIDALHVLTSLAGFEALLRGLEVHCWGLPFYAGWGLTHDCEHCSRRQRQLSLDELVHAALIDYPRYVSRDSGWFITPEQAVDDLVACVLRLRAAHACAGPVPPLGTASTPLSRARISLSVRHHGQGTGTSSCAGTNRRAGVAVDGPHRIVFRAFLPLPAGLWHPGHEGGVPFAGIWLPGGCLCALQQGDGFLETFLRRLIEERAFATFLCTATSSFPIESPLKKQSPRR